MHPAAASLRLFLDSSDENEWNKYKSSGLFYGVTTNPTILERDHQPCNLESLKQMTIKAYELGFEELQIQTWGDSVAEMTKNALSLASSVMMRTSDQMRVVIKVPATLDGLVVAEHLIDEGIPITITAVYRADQVLLASSIGADYAAPYLGRMNDSLGPGKGTENVIMMQDILSNLTHPYGRTRLLVASIRDASEMAYLASKGCDTFTFSPQVSAQLFNCESTIKAAADFESAAKRNP